MLEDTALFVQQAAPVLRWVLRSEQATQQRGSAAYYHRWRGWGPAYPETTGYLLPTLLNYQPYCPQLPLQACALRMGGWLLNQQLADGGFKGLHMNRPLVFDTGMVLLGILRLHEHTGIPAFAEAARAAVHWLYEQWSADGWTQAVWHPGWDASYRARVVWALALASRQLHTPPPDRQLSHYAAFLDEGLPWPGAAFRPGEVVWSHTLAYTWRGCWEAGLLLGRADVLKAVHRVVAAWKATPERPYPAGYDPQGKPITRYRCVPGHAQLALLFYRMQERYPDLEYGRVAETHFADIVAAPRRFPCSGWVGGLPGSLPVGGGYQSHRVINWGAKFFLDMLLARELAQR